VTASVITGGATLTRLLVMFKVAVRLLVPWLFAAVPVSLTAVVPDHSTVSVAVVIVNVLPFTDEVVRALFTSSAAKLKVGGGLPPVVKKLGACNIKVKLLPVVKA